MQSMKRDEKRKAREVVETFLERELVAPDNVDTVTEYLERDEPLRALETILETRRRNRRLST